MQSDGSVGIREIPQPKAIRQIPRNHPLRTGWTWTRLTKNSNLGETFPVFDDDDGCALQSGTEDMPSDHSCRTASFSFIEQRFGTQTFSPSTILEYPST